MDASVGRVFNMKTYTLRCSHLGAAPAEVKTLSTNVSDGTTFPQGTTLRPSFLAVSYPWRSFGEEEPLLQALPAPALAAVTGLQQAAPLNQFL